MKKSGELKGARARPARQPGRAARSGREGRRHVRQRRAHRRDGGQPERGARGEVAHGEGTEPNYPLAVLVSGTSASASEIVTGALKNHDRAVIIGETTFGKGSVQLVFTDLPDKAALKLTIAQYLTEPGDVSIQGVGVTPDIELDPMTVDPLEMDLTADTGGIKERDLSRALSNVARQGGRASVRGREVRPADEGAARAARARRRARRELRRSTSPSSSRATSSRTCSPASAPTQVRQARPFIADTRKAELDKVADELKGHGRRLERRARRTSLAAATPTPPGGRRREGRDRPAEQRGDGRRADEPQAHRDQHGARTHALPPLRRDQEREPDVRQQGARHRQARAGQVAHGDGAGGLVRRQGAQGRLDGRPRQGRATRVRATSPRTRSCAPTA